MIITSPFPQIPSSENQVKFSIAKTTATSNAITTSYAKTAKAEAPDFFEVVDFGAVVVWFADADTVCEISPAEVAVPVTDCEAEIPIPTTEGPECFARLGYP